MREKENLTLLGNQQTEYSMDYNPSVLEAFQNKHPENDLVSLLEPKYIEVWGKFLPRGGLSIDPYCNYGKPGTDWEQVAWNRMSNHDMFPEKVDNR